MTFLACATLTVGAIAVDPLLAGAWQREEGAASPSPSPKPELTVLHQHATADGRVLAYWLGTPPSADEGVSLASCTEELWFELREPGATRGRRLRYRPKGELFFSDWDFDIFSGDDAFVVLKADHYGPFEVVRTRDLESYLRGRSKPAEVTLPLAKGETASVHDFLGWRSPRAFEFRQSCCASERDCLHTIGSRRTSACGPYRDATAH